MSKIYIGFSRPHKIKIGSELIRLWLRTPYSHVYIRFDSDKMPSTVYHAAHGMVHFREYNNFLKENIISEEFELEVTNENRLSILKSCVFLAGESYGYSELLKILITDIAHTLGCDVNTYDGRGYICSELVGGVLSTNFGMTFNKPTYLLTPKDIYNSLDEK